MAQVYATLIHKGLWDAGTSARAVARRKSRNFCRTKGRQRNVIKSIGTVKRGILLAFTVEMRDGPTGDALVGAADKLRCQGRYDWFGEVLAEMNITETDTPGTYVFRSR